MTVDLSSLNTPGPIITKTSAPFWEAAEKEKLVFQVCKDCCESIFYPRIICPVCWSNNLIWKNASGRGELKTFSVVYKPGHPAWAPITPYVVGLVELVEGPTILSFIITNQRYSCNVGDKLVLAPTNISGRILPAFKLI